MNFIIVLICCALLAIGIHAADQKLSRPVTTMQTPQGLKSAPQSSYNIGKSSVQQLPASTSGPFTRRPWDLNTMRLVAIGTAFAVKDEVINCFDSVAYAKNNEERFENTIDILYRHRGIIGAGAMALVLKTTFSAPR